MFFIKSFSYNQKIKSKPVDQNISIFFLGGGHLCFRFKLGSLFASLDVREDVNLAQAASAIMKSKLGEGCV